MWLVSPATADELTAVETAVVGLGSVSVAALCFLPSGVARLGTKTVTIRFTDLFGSGYLLATGCVILGVAGVVERVRWERTSRVAGFGFGALAGATAMWIMAMEGLGRVVPRRFLPGRLSRFSVGLGTRPADCNGAQSMYVVVTSRGSRQALFRPPFFSCDRTRIAACIGAR